MRSSGIYSRMSQHELPRDLALSRIREWSRHALLDKQPTHFMVDLMIMKVIGG